MSRRDLSLLIVWGLSCILIGLARIVSSSWLWPPGAEFEEVQLGALAAGIVRNGPWPIEFRFSNLTGVNSPLF